MFSKVIVISLFNPLPNDKIADLSKLKAFADDSEFDPWLRRLFFPVNFPLSPLQKHVRKVVGGFRKKSCVSTGMRKPGNTYASPTAMI